MTFPGVQYGGANGLTVLFQFKNCAEWVCMDTFAATLPGFFDSLKTTVMYVLLLRHFPSFLLSRKK
jgi:hypothetical protein